MALEIVGLSVGPVTEVVKYFGKPILRQFNYLCCFNSNKQDLIEKAEKLKDIREEVQRRVSVALNNGEEVRSGFTTWLGVADEVQGNKIDVDNQIKDVQSGCLAVKSRFLLSRKAKKTAEAMEKLLGECPEKDNISLPPLPPSAAVPDILETPTPEFESRKQIEEMVMAILKDEKVNLMGVCGMGGLGKTTLALKVKDRVKVEHVFGESVMAVVSQQPDKLRIQAEMAENLGLDLKDATTLSSRAHKLRDRLTKGEKRILVILDDVWEDLGLEELGITHKSGSQGCTILLTSRDKDVLKRMDAEPICEMEILSKREAWDIFQQNVGTCLDDQTLLPMAQDVVEECRGLPLALVTVARALKGHDISTWHEALRQLKCSNPEDLETVLKVVYTPLKLSYDFLSQNAKFIFLLCCLFPEDCDIPVKNLIAYAMGLRMFEINKTYSLVEKLKSRCLLLEGSDEDHVRMHDIVRDVAIFIASSKEKQLIRYGDKSAWISTFLGERIGLYKGAIFPNLNLIRVHGDELQIGDDFFEGVINLNVLSVSRVYSWKSSLPHTRQLHKSLRTLVLDDMRLETISVVAEFENLESFICRNCPRIETLPIEVGKLFRLKLLEFSDCEGLKIVAPGIISSLIGLEELKMVGSFNGWEAERMREKKGRRNAALSELQFLSNLTCLTIEIKDACLVAEHFNLPPKVKKYDIQMYSSTPRGFFQSFFDFKCERRIFLYLGGKEIISSRYWFAKCISDVESMVLEGEGSNIVDLQQTHQNIRWLSLENSSTVKTLVNITSSIDSITTIFPRLEFLNVESLDNLEEICHIDGPLQERSSINAFHNLKTLCLYNLPALKHWWKGSPYQHNACLPQLQVLNIDDCEMMEQVFLWIDEEENENEIGTIIFPRLKILKLIGLPSLTSFSKGIEGIEFPLLTRMEINECPQLKSLVSNHDEDEDSSLLFCKQDSSGTFSRLESLRMYNCGKMTSLCSSSTAQNFYNLKKLIIQECGEMIKVFEGNKSESSPLLPQLQELEMIGLPKLESFFKWGSSDLSNVRVLKVNDCGDMVRVIEDDEGNDLHLYSGGTTRRFPQLQVLEMIGLPELKEFCNLGQIEFPLLREVSIFGCPKMERLSMGSLIAPNFNTVRVDFKDIAISTGRDLNAELQQHLFKSKDEESFYKWVLKVKGMERMHELWWSANNCLELEIEDCTQAAEQISFPSYIMRYRITIGAHKNDIERHYNIISSLDRGMRLNLPKDIILGNWIHECARSVGYLRLSGEGSNNLDLSHAQNLRYLTLGDCSKVKKLVKVTPPSSDVCATVFPHLEILNLFSLASLEEIYPMPEGSSIIAFNNLKELYLRDLPAVKHLWKSNSPYKDNASILQLERLHIVSCEMMEQVFLWNDEDDTGSENHLITIIFPNLIHLELSKLPRLKAVCNGTESIKFPLLSSLEISACPQLKSPVSIVCSTVNDNRKGIDNGDVDESVHFFCNPEKVDFSGLKKLSIGGYEDISSIWCRQILIQDFFAGLDYLSINDLNNIRSLFSSSIVTKLGNLRKLKIYRCVEMVRVIEDDDKETGASCGMNTVCLLPKLQKLRIIDLPKLEMFCGCALELPSLDKVSIDSCSEMNIFSLGSVTAPDLRTVNIDGREVINHTQDLNVTLQQPVYRGDSEFEE